MKGQRGGGVIAFGFALALAALAAAALAGWGTREEWWSFAAGFRILRWSAYAGAAAGALAFLGLLLLGGIRAFYGLLGLVLGLAVAWDPYTWYRTAREVPAIHDITTDTENPPGFVAILPLRKDARNPATYGGPEVAAQQREAYPAVRPLVLDGTPEQVFPLALRAAREMGWAVVASDPSQGRIEATATTFWFGFKDDVVVRLSSAGGKTRVDVRSVSRVGRSDVGTNARRVRAYLAKLRQLM